MSLDFESVISDVSDDPDYSFTKTYNYDLNCSVFDLTDYAKQGILILPNSLTCEINQSYIHINIWKPFFRYLIEKIVKEKDSIGWILIGPFAEIFEKAIEANPTHKLFKCPSWYVSTLTRQDWDARKAFKGLAEFQKKQNNIKIQW